MSEIWIFIKVIEDLFFREFHFKTLICGEEEKIDNRQKIKIKGFTKLDDNYNNERD